MTDLHRALDALTFARGYTARLLDATPTADWFRMPAGCASHVAWQVGHLATAQYRLGLERLRGRRAGDAALLDDAFPRLFGRTSVPNPDRAAYPHPDDIRAALDRVHAEALREWPLWADADLAAPTLPPHPIATTKLAGLLWCGRHELIHAGQVGLIRRALGLAPLW